MAYNPNPVGKAEDYHRAVMVPIAAVPYGVLEYLTYSTTGKAVQETIMKKNLQMPKVPSFSTQG